MTISANPYPSVRTHDFTSGPQFQQAMACSSDERWFTDEIWQNPFSNNHLVLVFVKAIRAAPGGPPLGALYLEFDWEQLTGELFRAAIGSSPAEQATRISLVDGKNRLVASSHGARFGTTVPLKAGTGDGLERRPDGITATAFAKPVRGFDGLGMRCVIEQDMATEAEIAATLAPERRFAA